MIGGFREFEFDLPEALLASLIRMFDIMPSAPLLSENVLQLPEAQGVYQLLHDDVIVYIGKTDAEAGLRQRLERHAWTIQHRCNLEPAKVFFKAIRVFVFTAIDLETQLIAHYGHGTTVSWNRSGFGSNDPGRERDTTKLKPNGFDANFPVDLDRPIRIEGKDVTTAATLLSALRGAVPYTVRSESSPHNPRKPHPDLEVQMTFDSNRATAREVVEAVVAALPEGWQATLLPGRVILYKERKVYSAGSVIAIS
jgi:hypothetical protein